MLTFGLVAHLFPDHEHVKKEIKDRKMKTEDGKIEEVDEL
jgi:hypothetical protein